MYSQYYQKWDNKNVRDVPESLDMVDYTKKTIYQQGMLELFRNYCSKISAWNVKSETRFLVKTYRDSNCFYREDIISSIAFTERSLFRTAISFIRAIINTNMGVKEFEIK